MPDIKLTPEELKYMSLFQDVTRVTARDCIITEDRIIFLVNPGQTGLAIGKGGTNVRKLKNVIGKDIEIVEYNDDMEKLVENIMAPARVRAIKIVQNNSKKVMHIRVDFNDKGIAIGKNGRNVQRAKLILKRYKDIDSVIIE
ncbi:transcription elongation factor NusA [Sulfolobales archaeon HS-7]|nr:transcription elongation factor NusA [Sulfolobales archaeon HS-7]